MVNTVGKDISEVLISYTAGFLDADGAIMAPIEKNQEKRFKLRARIVVRLTQRDCEILLYLKNQFNIGRVVLNGTAYDWIIRDQKDVKWFLELLNPFILVKKKQALIALQILVLPKDTKKDLIRIANLSDSLSSYNVRSKLKRHKYSLMVQEIFSRND